MSNLTAAVAYTIVGSNGTKSHLSPEADLSIALEMLYQHRENVPAVYWTLEKVTTVVTRETLDV